MSNLRVNSISARAGSGVISVPSGNVLYAPGHVLQVKHASLGSSWSAATTADNFYPVTGLSVTLTPASANSRFIIFVNLYCASSSTGYQQKYRIARNGAFPILGSPEGGRPVATGMVNGYNSATSDWTYNVVQLSGVHQDSPGMTSELTYVVQAASYAGSTLYINRSHTWQNSAANGYDAVPVSTLTVMEIAQ